MRDNGSNDLQRLEDIGFNRTDHERGYGKGYRFVGNFAMYPLNFTEQEALVFSVLPSVLDTSKLPPGFESAYDKVMATHVKETRKRYDTLENVADMIQMGTPAYRENNANFCAHHGSDYRLQDDQGCLSYPEPE